MMSDLPGSCLLDLPIGFTACDAVQSSLITKREQSIRRRFVFQLFSRQWCRREYLLWIRQRFASGRDHCLYSIRPKCTPVSLPVAVSQDHRNDEFVFNIQISLNRVRLDGPLRDVVVPVLVSDEDRLRRTDRMSVGKLRNRRTHCGWNGAGCASFRFRNLFNIRGWFLARGLLSRRYGRNRNWRDWWRQFRPLCDPPCHEAHHRRDNRDDGYDFSARHARLHRLVRISDGGRGGCAVQRRTPWRPTPRTAAHPTSGCAA